MASTLCIHQVSVPLYSSAIYRKPNTSNCFLHRRSQFVSPQALKSLKGELQLSYKFSISKNTIYKQQLPTRRPNSVALVVALQSNFLRVVQTVWRVAKDGIEAGTNLVPDSIPKPIARVSVAGVALTISLFVLKSFLSTAFFVLGTMGFVYFAFIAMNKDEGPKGGGGPGGGTTGVDDSLEEARRIMEKYK
ncbi:uncharacterized protein LOC122070872 [Macadamia integrifolia]|uniref:uncharacterized protein LOC122070872 n=1 Tax=Macadamia integrifolia TaxID=60698 RepID=UPI001C4F306A|nr:uncharacterized protein LOC122070872 [Macadamia integrifolia]